MKTIYTVRRRLEKDANKERLRRSNNASLIAHAVGRSVGSEFSTSTAAAAFALDRTIGFHHTARELMTRQQSTDLSLLIRPYQAYIKRLFFLSFFFSFSWFVVADISYREYWPISAALYVRRRRGFYLISELR